jgi:hypothetical protein
MTWSSLFLTALITLNLTQPLVPSESYNEELFYETPVMRLNVYMMGQVEVDTRLTVLVNENIDYLNQEFEGVIRFEFNEFFMDHSKGYLPILYDEFNNHTEANSINRLVRPIEVKGAINVFLFDTYTEEGTDRALMGFTPRLSAKQEVYGLNSPNFDRIFMAYAGLENKTTLVHEMGHFLGLNHPWELSGSSKLTAGIRSELDEEHNHMSYGPNVMKFTPQQLESMRKHALKYRRYLMDRVIQTRLSQYRA